MKVGVSKAEDQPVQHPTQLATLKQSPCLSRRERRKIATREALIQAAQEVIATKGMYLAAIEEITERADVAKGSFYQYFQDRNDLLRVLLIRRLEELRASIETIPTTGTFAQRVSWLVRSHLEYFLRHEDFLLFLHQIRGFSRMADDETSAVRDAYRGYLAFLAEQLLPADSTALPDSATQEERACVLLGILTGFLSHYAILHPLTELVPHLSRIELSLTEACLAFWK